MVSIVRESPSDHFLLWHDLESERHAIAAALPGVTEVWGSQDLAEREGIDVAARDFLAGLGLASSATSPFRESHTRSRSLAIASIERPVATLSGLSSTRALPLSGTASASRSLISSQFSWRSFAALPPIRTRAQWPWSLLPSSRNFSAPLR